jgi:hypothetical protein
MKRFLPAILGFALVLGSCGGGEMTLPEYVDRLNTIIEGAVSQADDLYAGVGAVMGENADLSAFTPQDLQIALEEVAGIEEAMTAATAAIDPPEVAREFHDRYFDARFSTAREALAIRAGSAISWEELSETPEMAAYRKVVAQDKQTCLEFQADMDATGGREVFADMPWIPNDLKEVVIALLACDVYPANPEDMFRP